MRIRRNFLALFGLALLGAGGAPAQVTITWSNAGGDSLFNNPANWQGGVVPSPGDHWLLPTPANASGSVVVEFDSSRTAGNITASFTGTGYYFYPSVGGINLTLNGDVATGAGSSHWLFFELPTVLPAGNHTYTIDGAAVYHGGIVSGPGSITKAGPNELYLVSPNTYSGGTAINGGMLFAGASDALGTGTVTVNGGTLGLGYLLDEEATSVWLKNNLRLGTTAQFSDSPGTALILGDAGANTTILPVTGVSEVTIVHGGTEPLYLEGRLRDGDSPTSYAFTSNIYVLGGTNDYTGTTTVDEAAVIFATEASVASLPAGSISGTADSYVGLGQATATSVGNFLGRFDINTFLGVVGFDGHHEFKGNIDLSSFPAGVGLGTNSNATLFGQITPPASSDYRFTGQGWLYLADDPGVAPTSHKLTGAAGVQVTSASPYQPPFVLVLGRDATNDYTGATAVAGAGLIFDSPGAFSGSSTIELGTRAYLGATEAAGFTVAGFVSLFTDIEYPVDSVLGFDASGIVNGLNNTPLTVSNLNLASLPSRLYVGSASHLILNGTLTTTTGGADDYYFTGYDSGIVQVDAALAGAGRKALIGLPNVHQGDDAGLGIVVLNNAANAHGGGTVLNSGKLIAAGAALGPGPFVSQPQTDDDRVYLESTGTFSPGVTLDPGELWLTHTGTLTLSGTVSGPGQLVLEGIGTLHLGGSNTFTGGSRFLDRSLVYVDHNNALGTGSVEFEVGADAAFTTAAPVIAGGLYGGLPYDDDGYDYTELTLAGAGGTTLTIVQADVSHFYGDFLQGASPGALVKSGAGTLYLYPYQGSTYSGGTTINQGRLVAGSSTALGAGPVTLNGGALGTGDGVVLANTIAFGASGGVLGGNGIFAGAVTIGTNATLDPGDSPGTLTFANGLTLAPGGALDLEVQFANGTAGSGYDLVKVSAGLLDITATAGTKFTLNLLSLGAGGSPGPVGDFNPNSAYTWNFATSTAGISGFSASKFDLVTTGFTNPLNGGLFSLSTAVVAGKATLQLNFTPVPEPSTYALFAAGLGWLAFRRRRGR